MVGQAVEVLVGLVDVVEFPVRDEETVTVGLALLVLEPGADADFVGLVELVFEDMAVLVLEPEPVEVLLGASVLVTVNEFIMVIVGAGDREAEEDAVDVLEPRMELV